MNLRKISWSYNSLSFRSNLLSFYICILNMIWICYIFSFLLSGSRKQEVKWNRPWIWFNIILYTYDLSVTHTHTCTPLHDWLHWLLCIIMFSVVLVFCIYCNKLLNLLSVCALWWFWAIQKVVTGCFPVTGLS